jgi:hypothetical protein
MRLQEATAHPGTATELMGARLRFADRLQAATAHPGTVTELMGARLRLDETSGSHSSPRYSN